MYLHLSCIIAHYIDQMLLFYPAVNCTNETTYLQHRLGLQPLILPATEHQYTDDTFVLTVKIQAKRIPIVICTRREKHTDTVSMSRAGIIKTLDT